jgi:hypothetical protein
MLQAIPLWMGILTATIAQPNFAMNSANYSPSPMLERSSGELHALVILDIGIGSSPSWHERDERWERERWERERWERERLERQRLERQLWEREHRGRWEPEHHERWERDRW